MKRFRINLSFNSYANISKVFLLFGIDIDPTVQFVWKQRLLFCFRIFSQAILIYLSAVIIFTFYFRVVGQPLSKMKVQIAKHFFEIVGVILWFSSYQGRIKISNVIRKVKELEYNYRLKQSVILGPVTLTLIVLGNIAAVLEIYRQGKRMQKSTFNNLTFTLLHLDGGQAKRCIHLILVQFYVAYVFIFPHCILYLYLMVSKSLENSLKCHARKNLKLTIASEISAEDFRKCFWRYNGLLQVLNSSESAFSFILFIIVCESTLGMFYGILLSLQGGWYIKFIVRPIYSLMSFFLIALASRVSEADSFARQSNKQVLLRASSMVSANDMVKFQSLNSGPSFKLSAWGTVDFNKSFFLSTLGCILTYALLAANL